ncbi:MAG: hypothetical protein VZS44_02910 [Bacilli bacterium]|nr:hypothetical protein [Bacilli bacterium]
MNKDYKILKKHYGEKFAQLCRELFPSLLEQEGLLSSIILSKFSPNHSLYDDLKKAIMIDNFKNYIYSLVDVEKKEIEINKSVRELLSDAGYNFYECKSEEDIQSFKKYYAKGEELCTFNGGRLDKCYVFWAVKKDIDQIKREDFKNPTREDEYGTSVISIQFTRQGHTLSIKNRYNHTINNPDATFSNNLDNIIPGLTNAFEKEYDLEINQNERNYFYLSSYLKADDGKWYKCNHELNNIYYCINNVIIDNGQVKQYDKSRYIIIEYFIIDMKEKTLKLYDDYISDCFPDSFKNIESINIKRTNNNKQIIIKLNGKEDVIITIDDLNQIVSIDDKNTEIIKDNYLHYSDLSNINLPKLKKVGYYFMANNLNLKELYLPELKETKDWFIGSNSGISTINLPKLEIVGDCFLSWNYSLTTLDLPNLKVVGDSFINKNNIIKEINMPNLEEVGEIFLSFTKKISKINLPKLKKTGKWFLLESASISEVNLPNLEEVGDAFMASNKRLRKLDLPKLKEVADYFLCQNGIISEINLPNLEKTGDAFMEWNQYLTKIDLPKLKEVGDNFLSQNKILIIKEVNLPNLEKKGKKFMINSQKIKKLSLQILKEVGKYN